MLKAPVSSHGSLENVYSTFLDADIMSRVCICLQFREETEKFVPQVAINREWVFMQYHIFD